MTTALTEQEIAEALHTIVQRHYRPNASIQIGYDLAADAIVCMGVVYTANTCHQQAGISDLGFVSGWLEDSVAEYLEQARVILRKIAEQQPLPQPRHGGARPGAGRKPSHPEGRTVPLGVGNVAPDVAQVVAAAPQPTAYVEAAIRHYAAHLAAQP